MQWSATVAAAAARAMARDETVAAAAARAAWAQALQRCEQSMMQQTVGPLHHSVRNGGSGAANGVARGEARCSGLLIRCIVFMSSVGGGARSNGARDTYDTAGLSLAASCVHM